MSKSVAVCTLVLILSLACYAQGPSGTTNACGETDVTAGGSFTWTSTYSVALLVTPAPGTTWFLGSTQVVIPPNGSVTVNVPPSAMSGEYDLNITFNTNMGGYPCGTNPRAGGGKVIIQS